jgi:hypothetical protein
MPMGKPSFALRVSALLGLALVFCGARAWGADAQQSAMAEQLFREGRELVQGGNVPLALEKFEASQQLDPSLGTLLNLADCMEKLGRTASAWARFSEAEQTARLEKDRIRERAASEHAHSLEARLIRLRIVLAPQVSASDVTIELDGKPLAIALLGTATPVDPGEHRVVARAAGKRDWISNVQLATPGETVLVTIAEMSPEPERAASAPMGLVESKPSLVANPPRPESETLASVTEAPTRASSGWARPGLVTIACAAVSVVALGLGTGYAIAASGAWNDAKDAGCHNGLCPTAGAQNRAETAGSRADVATVSFISAGVLAGATVVSYLLLDRPRPASPPLGQVVLNATWTPSQAGASLGMAF